MGPLTTAALIAGGTAIASGVTNMIHSGKQAKKQRKENRRLLQEQINYNEKSAQDSRKWMEDYYKKYDSPEAMLRQYREAGLNPYSFNGQIGSMSSQMGNAPSVDMSGLISSNSSLSEQETQRQIDAVNSLFSNSSSIVQLLSQIEDLKQKQIDTDQKRKLDTVFNEGVTPDDEGSIVFHGGGLSFGQLAALSRYYTDYNTALKSDVDISQNFDPLRRLAYLYRSNYYDGNSPTERYDNQLKAHRAAYNALYHGLANSQYLRGEELYSAKRDNRLRDIGINPNGTSTADAILRFAFGSNDSYEGIQSLQQSLGAWIKRMSELSLKLSNFELPGLESFKNKKNK